LVQSVDVSRKLFHFPTWHFLDPKPSSAGDDGTFLDDLLRIFDSSIHDYLKHQDPFAQFAQFRLSHFSTSSLIFVFSINIFIFIIRTVFVCIL